jgi:hypothetical protein
MRGVGLDRNLMALAPFVPGIKARMRRRAAPRCPAAVCLQTAAPDLPPGGRVCCGCQQKFWGRTGTIKRLEPASARLPEVGRVPVETTLYDGHRQPITIFQPYLDVVI